MHQLIGDLYHLWASHRLARTTASVLWRARDYDIHSHCVGEFTGHKQNCDGDVIIGHELDTNAKDALKRASL